MVLIVYLRKMPGKLLTMTEEVVKSIILYFRYKSKKWLNNVLE
ncbi:MAG TPA: hypothetical protein PLO45_04405 [Defluviitoga sp.]|nr:hypothetical protein [Defluviitoga sp.]